MEKYFFIQDLLEDQSEIPADSILSRTLHQNTDLRMIRFDFSPGQELSEHTSAKPAILHFLAGSGTVTVGEDEKSVNTNSWVYLPSNMPHSVVAKTQLTMLLLMIEK